MNTSSLIKAEIYIYGVVTDISMGEQKSKQNSPHDAQMKIALATRKHYPQIGESFVRAAVDFKFCGRKNYVFKTSTCPE